MGDTRPVFTKEHFLYDIFIKFHTDQYDKDQRQRAKQWLHEIHYGNWDTTAAMEEAKKLRVEA